MIGDSIIECLAAWMVEGLAIERSIYGILVEFKVRRRSSMNKCTSFIVYDG
jgi:hypothetical protein